MDYERVDRRTQEDFVQFLCDNDAEDDFMHCLYRYRDINIRLYLHSYRGKPHDLFVNAFCWCESDVHYWEILDRKWREHLNQKK